MLNTSLGASREVLKFPSPLRCLKQGTTQQTKGMEMKKLIMVLFAFAAAMLLSAGDMPDLTANANGYTWTFTLLDGNTAAITSCWPEPEGKLVIPSGLDIEVWKDGALITHVPVSSVEGGCFANCTKITSVEFPDTTSFLHIRYGAFKGCNNITSVAMHSGLASIGSEAFASCSSLKQVRVPQSVDSIGEGAFLDCLNMLEVVYPNHLTHLGQGSLAGCGSITNMVVPISYIQRAREFPVQYREVLP